MPEQELDNLEESPDVSTMPKDAIKAEIDKLGQETPKTEEAVTETPAPTESPVEKAEEVEPLILGKFKTQEDVVKAYQEVEKMATSNAQRASEYRNALGTTAEFDESGNIVGVKTPQPTPSPVAPQPQADVMAQLEQRYTSYEQMYGPVRANIMLQAEITNAIVSQQTAPIEELRAVSSIDEQKRSIRDTDKDFTKYERDIDKHLKRMDAKSKQNPMAVQAVYNMVLGENYKKLISERETDASQKAVEIETQKQKAQVEHQTRTPEEPPLNLNDTSISSSELARKAGLVRTERY